MDGKAFMALATLGGFGRCTNPACDHATTLVPPRSVDTHRFDADGTDLCNACGARITFPPAHLVNVERLERIANGEE